MNALRTARYVYKRHKSSKGSRFAQRWLAANIDRYEWPKQDIALVFLLIAGEATATIFAAFSWAKEGWSFGTEFAVFVGGAALMLYAVGATLRGHLPFIKPSAHEQRRRYASKVLGIHIPYRSDTRSDKPHPIELGNSTKDDVLRFVGQMYSHDLLSNGTTQWNLSLYLHPALWKQVQEATDLLCADRPQIILSHSNNFHPSLATTPRMTGEDNAYVVINERNPTYYETRIAATPRASQEAPSDELK